LCRLLFCGAFQKSGKRIELRVPVGAVLCDPRRGLFHGLSSEATAMNAALNLAPQQASRFEYAQMLRNRGQRHPERLGKIADLRVAER